MPYTMKDFTGSVPDIYAALGGLGRAVGAGGLDPALVELVKLRASQLNGCAYCLQFHLNAGRKAGLDQARLDLLAAWHEAPGFSDRERAALAWTEALTLGRRGAEKAAALAQARSQFNDQELFTLSACVGLINAWNRIAGGLDFPPPPAA